MPGVLSWAICLLKRKENIMALLKTDNLEIQVSHCFLLSTVLQKLQY